MDNGMKPREYHHHIENEPEFKGMRVNTGIEQPETVDGESVKRFLQKKRNLLSPDEYVEGILRGDISLWEPVVFVYDQRWFAFLLFKRVIIKDTFFVFVLS